MARFTRKKSHRRSKKITIPLAVVAGFLPGALRLKNHMTSFQDFGQEASRIFLGYTPSDGTFKPQLMTYGTLPIVIGFVAHYAANKFGLNRVLARANIPFIRI